MSFEFMTMEEVFIVTYLGVFLFALSLIPIVWFIEKKKDSDEK